ncbi:virulence-associated protein E [Staphylococcus equorum subsp. linens]|nr:virulence-associated protein E [Staphylococcus equorum subsp. linens]QQT16786.1 virulence-associated protein E [Staphylococcus equorum]
MTVEEKEVTQDEIFENMNKLQETNQQQNWQSKLRISESTGAYKKSTTNGELIIQNDPHLKDMVQYDSFEKITKLKRLPHWRSNNDTNYYWSDMDTIHVKSHIDRCYNLQFSTDILNEVIDKEAYEHKFHPIKSMIESKEWDGVKRVENLFIDYLGSPDTHYNREVAKKWVMGAVARIYKPGIKFDTMAVLYGSQGGGKSTVASKMGGEWYNQSVKSFVGDEAFKKLQGSWVCEIEELSAFQNSTIEDIKGFVSSVIDVYRASYGRRVERHPRQCIFIGTTNNYEFLKDKTGNRRFWPVTTNKSKATKSPFEELTQDVVQQMYAEAKTYFDESPTEKALLLDKEADATALQMQTEHAEKDALIGEIEDFLERPLPSDYWYLDLDSRRRFAHDVVDEDYIKLYGDGKLIELPNTKPGQYVWRDKVCSLEIWRVMMKRDDQPQPHHTRKIDDALRNTSYCSKEKKRTRFGEGVGRQYGLDVDLSSYYKNLKEVSQR